MTTKQQCGATWKLNCGCCADISILVCERAFRHKGPHWEQFEGGNGTSLPKYRFEWEDVT